MQNIKVEKEDKAEYLMITHTCYPKSNLFILIKQII